MPATKAAPERPKISEREILAACLDALKVLGIEADRHNVGMAMGASGRKVRFGKKGEGDIQGHLPDGRRLSVEVKAPGKRPTPEQFDNMHRLNAGGCVALWTDDAVLLMNALRRIVRDGWRVEIADDGTPFVTDDPESK